MKYCKKRDASTKVRIIKPLLDDWNDIAHDDWIIEKGESPELVTIRRKTASSRSLHGCLIHDLSCVCEAYGWLLCVQYDEERGLYARI